RIRQETEIPLVLMTYMNPVLAMGLPTFAERAASAGVDGVVVPDLSLEASPEIREALDAHGVDMIQLVAPSTPPTRAAAIADASRGFLYVVASYGTCRRADDVLHFFEQSIGEFDPSGGRRTRPSARSCWERRSIRRPWSLLLGFRPPSAVKMSL